MSGLFAYPNNLQMKVKGNNATLVILFIVILGCSEKKPRYKELAKAENELIEIKLESFERPGEHLIKMLKNIAFVPLEFDSLNLIMECSKIKFYNNRFYILDRKLSSIKVFNTAGKFLHNIGNLGAGPGEYSRLDDFDIDPLLERILVFSSDNQAIYSYKYTGEFIDRSLIHFFGGYFNLFGKSKYIFYASYNIYNDADAKNILITDTLGQPEIKHFYFPQEARSALEFSGQISKNEKGVLFTHALSDTIYQVTTEYLFYPKYIIDLGGDTYSKTNNIFDHKRYFQIGLDYSILENNIIELGDYLYFDYIKNRKERNAIFNVRTRQLFSESSFDSDDMIFKLFKAPVGTLNDSTLISVIYPSTFFGLKDYTDPDIISKLKYENKDLYELMTNFKKEDNPILFLYSMK